MDEIRLQLLENLDAAFDKASMRCDPLEFAVRQNKLLHSIAQVVLWDLEEYKESLKQVTSEDSQASS